MKKFLLLAAAALLGLGGTHATPVKHIVYESTITPVSELRDGGIYLIYDASKVTAAAANNDAARTAFRKVEPGATAITGDHNASKNAADLDYFIYAWQAVQDGSNWKFRHIGSDKYIENAKENKNLSVVAAADAGSWTLQDYNSTHGAFRVKNASSDHFWDGVTAQYAMCTWTPGTDLAGSHWYQFFEVTEDMLQTRAYNAPLKLSYPDGTTCYTTTLLNVTPDEETEVELPFYIRPFTHNKATFTHEQLESTDDIALEFAEGYTPFKLFNARYQRWGTTNDTGLTTVTGEFSAGEWYLEEFDGEATFKVYSAVHDTYFGAIPSAGPATPKATAENAQTYRLDQLVNGAEHVYNLFGSTNISWNINTETFVVSGWNDSDQGSCWFMVYDEEAFAANREIFFAGTDDGTIHTNMPAKMTELWGSNKAGGLLADAHTLWDHIGGLSSKSHPDMEQIKANLESALYRAQHFRLGRYNLQTLLDDLNAAIAAGNEVKVSDQQITWSQIKLKGDMLVPFVPAEAAAAWQSVIDNTVIPVTQDDITDLTAAYNQLSTQVGGVSINFRPHKSTNDLKYICADNAEHPTCSYANTSRAWTLIRNEANTGFYLYNEYTGRYLKHGATGSTANPAMGYVTDESQASVYNLEVYDLDLPTYAFKTIDSNIANDRRYLHLNNQDYLQCWEIGTESSFYVSLISDHQAATEHFNGINDTAGESMATLLEAFSTKPFGSDLSHYTYAPEVTRLGEAYTHAAALVADQDSDGNELRSAADDYRTAYNAYVAANPELTCTLNMPAPGDLIRLKWVSEDGNTVQYASNENNSANPIRLPMVTDGTSVNTVWYLDESNRLVSYSTGLCIGKFPSTGKANASWATVLSTSTNASTEVTFEEYVTNPSHYRINVGDDRHIYGAGNVVDCGGNVSATDAHIGYQWMLERVYKLPIPIGDTDVTTVYAPVDLNFDYDGTIHAIAHIGKIVDATVEHRAIAQNNGTYLPAHTPALLQVNERTGGNVYAEVIYPAAAEAAPALYADEPAAAENHFKANILAQAKEEGMSYYTLNAAGDAFVPEDMDDAAHLPGFTTHLAVSDAEDPQTSYTLKDTTSIEEITADSAANKAADTVYYDLCGRRVAKPSKGIYVTGNGNKVIF